MATTLLVGLDVGTTTTKAVAFTDTGEPVATGSASTPWTVTPTGAETTAQDLLDSATTALAALLSDCPPGHIAGLGVTGLAESGVLVDRSGSSVTPVIAWHDTRDGVELAELRAGFEDEFAATTGLPLRQQWSLTKHRWLTRHVPGVAAAVRRFNVPEWIVKALGGEEATEQSLASRTGWLDLAGRRWWPEGLDWSGAAESLMPPLVTAGTALGRVSADAALGRLTGAVLTVAGHDHQVAAIGANAAGVGDQLDSCGTAEALVRTVVPGLDRDVVGGLANAGITVGWHAAADHWCLLGATQGGLALGRILAMLGHPRDELDRAALAVSSPSVRVNAPAFGRIDIHRHRRRREPGAGVAGRAGDRHRPGRRAARRDDGRVRSAPVVRGHRRLVNQPGAAGGETAPVRLDLGVVDHPDRCARCRAAGRPRRRRHN